MEQLRAEFLRQAEKLALTEQVIDNFLPVHRELANWLNNQISPESPFILGINGAQGAGKSTFSIFTSLCQQVLYQRRTLILSIDDLYLTKAERAQLSRDKHPLLATRGVPGTHDIQLGEKLIQSICSSRNNQEVLVPRFDKAIDDRLPENQWEPCSDKPDMIIVEGWCVGVPEQPEEELSEPLNALEEREDPNGSWRNYVNHCLANEYQDFFSSFDAMLMLKVPGFHKVLEWRRLQEEKLRKSRSGAAIMSAEEIDRFIQHYERITMHGLSVMPAKVDVLINVEDDHSLSMPVFNKSK